ncbi:MAG: hypothetical protein K8W52_37065 [Deltaproteobacteria bacterium]|nr:hypothetical protein [Deltaproteobacteria bacterium]
MTRRSWSPIVLALVLAAGCEHAYSLRVSVVVPVAATQTATASQPLRVDVPGHHAVLCAPVKEPLTLTFVQQGVGFGPDGAYEAWVSPFTAAGPPQCRLTPKFVENPAPGYGWPRPPGVVASGRATVVTTSDSSQRTSKQVDVTIALEP